MKCPNAAALWRVKARRAVTACGRKYEESAVVADETIDRNAASRLAGTRLASRNAMPRPGGGEVFAVGAAVNAAHSCARGGGG